MLRQDDYNVIPCSLTRQNGSTLTQQEVLGRPSYRQKSVAKSDAGKLRYWPTFSGSKYKFEPRDSSLACTQGRARMSRCVLDTLRELSTPSPKTAALGAAPWCCNGQTLWSSAFPLHAALLHLQGTGTIQPYRLMRSD